MTQKADWPFDKPSNTAAITTAQVLSGEHPILLAVCDEDDGSWQFLYGTTDDPRDARIVALDSLYELDRSISELADLPGGWCAWRESPESAWRRELVD